MRKAILIANPNAGQFTLQRERSINTLCKALKKRGILIEAQYTNAPNEASLIASEAAAKGYTDVIVSGGDGTINEAVQGLVGTGLRLTVWPTGTANVLGKELGMPRNNATQLAELISQGDTIQMNLGCAEIEATNDKRYFFLMAGIGLDASIVNQVNPVLKKGLGQAAFVYSGLEHLANWEPVSFEIEVNDEKHLATFAAIGKAPHYGGNLSITPNARLDQAEFEICLINSTNRLRYLQLLTQAIGSGVEDNQGDIRFFRATKARAVGEVMVQADGELIGTLPMSFSIASHTIEVTIKKAETNALSIPFFSRQ